MATDRESAELIEKLLEEDEDLYVHQGAELEDAAAQDDPNDSDYAETPARKKPRNVKQSAIKTEEDSVGEGEGNGKRKIDRGRPRTRPRLWTKEEEVLFVEALELYGRKWNKCAEHIQTRDPRSVASHAQKHFIKLCVHGQPLPEKVAESGVGYTLSGKPLDPSSSAAFAYGFRYDEIKRLDADKFAVVKKGVAIEKIERQRTDNAAVSTGMDVDSVDPGNAQQEDVGGQETGREKQTQHRPSSKLCTTLKSTPTVTSATVDDSHEFMKHVRTDYALSRPQRAATRNRTVQMGNTSESIELVECEEFMTGDEGGGVVQPFTIDVSAEALLLIDFHAHLSEYEIIGLLAGTWDAERRHLTVREAMPCQRASGSEGRTSVELDPAAEVNARAEMDAKGLVGTGWYHSHPVFSATPSLKDIENQRNYQTLFRQHASSIDPFIGLIISPYEAGLPAPKSRTCGFYVVERNQGIKPFRLRLNVVDRLASYSDCLLEKCDSVLEMTKSDPSRTDLESEWRNWTFLKDGTKTGDALTKLRKLQLSLMSYFMESDMQQAKALGEELANRIEKIWKA